MVSTRSTLTCFSRPIESLLQLLSRNENGLTFGLGYALLQSPHLVRVLLRHLGVTLVHFGSDSELRLQETSAEGITDLELHAENLHVILEAKKHGWPGIGQLRRYTQKLRWLSGKRILCAVGMPLVGASPAAGWEPGHGVVLKHLRWVDILGMVVETRKRAGEQVLKEYGHFMQEVLHMQAYDREVLVRDVKWGTSSFDMFFKHLLYECQASEIAEPLFFAPCFSGNVLRVHKGIHYFSRVYYKATFSFADQNATRQSLAKAEAVIKDKVGALRHKKTTAREIAYLESLPPRWKKGIKLRVRMVKKGDRHAVFFLGEPIPLPRPVFKDGKMIPLGFSMSLEQLMNGSETTFRC